MASTTIEVPTLLRDRLRALKEHPRQAYHEVIERALDALQHAPAGRDPILEKHRAWLRSVAQKHGMDVRIVGSRARGTARSDDDLDVVCKPEAGRTLFDLATFTTELQARLPCGVDVRTHAAIPAGPRKAMLKGAVKP